jgi:hypothetical protein
MFFGGCYKAIIACALFCFGPTAPWLSGRSLPSYRHRVIAMALRRFNAGGKKQLVGWTSRPRWFHLKSFVYDTYVLIQTPSHTKRQTCIQTQQTNNYIYEWRCANMHIYIYCVGIYIYIRHIRHTRWFGCHWINKHLVDYRETHIYILWAISFKFISFRSCKTSRCMNKD